MSEQDGSMEPVEAELPILPWMVYRLAVACFLLGVVLTCIVWLAVLDAT